MILQSLCAYYDRISESNDPSIPTEGFSSEKAHFALVVDKQGRLVQILDLRETKGKKQVPRNVVVPQGPKKSVNIAASFLWGSTSYVLSADNKGKPNRTAACHAEFKKLHEKLLRDCEDDGAKAILAFLCAWDPKQAAKLQDWEDMQKGNILFQLDGELRFIHERPKLKQVWLNEFGSLEADEVATCLISGERAPIARTHPSIKGVTGAQSSGANLVSFNLPAFCSYAKEQNFNAPISVVKAAAYTKALNHLLASDRNTVRIADMTAVFWTERESPVEGFFGMIIDPLHSGSDDHELATYLDSVRQGRLSREYDPDIKFYILGLSPNASRLSVRFWHMSTVRDISEKLGQHFRDLEVVRSFESEPEFPGMWQLLRETNNEKSKEGPSPLLAGAVMRSILSGGLYPQALLSAVVNRIRADQKINYLRAAIIKSVLNRKNRILNQGLEVHVSLDKDNMNAAYLLGRLFAVLEKAQQDAIPGVNTTIKDRYFGAASATPSVVFPQLLRLTQHWVQKAEWGRIRDKQIEEIMGNIQGFPAHLKLDQQGLFAIGYYHQRQDFFKKNPKDNEEKE